MKPPAPVTSARVEGIASKYSESAAFWTALLLLGLVVVGAGMVRSMGPRIDLGLYNSVVTLHSGDLLTQTLALDGRTVPGFRVRLGDVVGDGLLIVEMETLDAEGAVLATRTRRVRLADLSADATAQIDIDPLPPVGAVLRVSLSLRAAGDRASMGLWATEGHTYEPGQLVLNGQPHAADLAIDATYSALQVWPAAARAFAGFAGPQGWVVAVSLALAYCALVTVVLFRVAALADQPER